MSENNKVQADIRTTLIARRANALIELSMPEDQQLVLIKDIQRDPVRQIIEHLDLVIVRKGEKVTVDVSVHVEGEPYPGTMVQLENTTVSVEAEATHIPEFISVSVEGLEEGSKILAGQLSLPAGTTLLTDPELMVIAITVPAKGDDTPVVAEGEGAQASTDASSGSGDSGASSDSEGSSDDAGGE